MGEEVEGGGWERWVEVKEQRWRGRKEGEGGRGEQDGMAR